MPDLVDPLQINIPAAGVDTTRPLIPEADYVLQITDYVLSHNEKTGVNTLDFLLVTTTPIEGVDGRPIPPNSRVFLDWPFDLAERAETKYPGAWRDKVINAIDAILGTDISNRPDITKDTLDLCKGKMVIGHVKIDVDKEGVSRNKVTKLKKGAV